MPQFLLSVHHLEITEPLAPEAMERAYAKVGAFNEDLIALNAFVFGGGLHAPSAAKVVRSSDAGSSTADGPYNPDDELGGFWIINAGDMNAALMWAAKGAEACGHAVQVRELQG
jgi:hypothetical protein